MMNRINRSREKMRFLHLVFSSFLLNIVVSVVIAEEDDIRCLNGLKTSLNDPQQKLSSWSFSNTSSNGYICSFVGVSCWNESENRLIALQLPSKKLQGLIPDSLQYCGSLQTLDLSNNALSGTIPSQICHWLPYLVTLDLSQNNLTGEIPPEFVNCTFLNTLILKDNRLSGPIPYELSLLQRLKKLSVSNNHLSGQIPSFPSGFDSSDFDGNKGLCGQPLGFNCSSGGHGGDRRRIIIIISAAIFGFIVALLIGFVFWLVVF